MGRAYGNRWASLTSVSSAARFTARPKINRPANVRGGILMCAFVLRLCARLAFLLAIATMAAPTIGVAPASAETTVKWLYIETNPEIIQYWKDVIAKYEQAHPGVKIATQFLEN